MVPLCTPSRSWTTVCQDDNFPRLAIVAKYILAIPASSATSERFFSAAGLTVSSLRCNLSENTTENLLKIRLNLSKVQSEEADDTGTGASINNLREQEAEEEEEDDDI